MAPVCVTCVPGAHSETHLYDTMAEEPKVPLNAKGTTTNGGLNNATDGAVTDANLGTHETGIFATVVGYDKVPREAKPLEPMDDAEVTKGVAKLPAPDIRKVEVNRNTMNPAND